LMRLGIMILKKIKNIWIMLCKIFCTENNNISIKQINEWNAKPNSEKKYFAGNEARSMETFKFVPRTKNLDTELNELFDNL
jgi:hypothetical protein